jgi:hypothetical protein
MDMKLALATIAGALCVVGFAPPSIAAPGAAPSATTPKFFVVVRGVDEAPNVKSEMVEEAKRLFTEELATHAEFTLKPPPELGDAASGDVEAFKAALRAHKLRALELTLRILEVTRGLESPPEGKSFRVLKRGIKLAVFGTTLPDKVMAIGGDGDSLIASEIRKNEDPDKEGKALLLEATKVAIKQAVDMTVTKLMLPPPKEKKAKKK